MNTPNRTTHIRLTSHPEPGTAATRFPIRWGAATPRDRGPVIGTVTNPADRNVIGAHGGAYSVYRALAISARALNPLVRPDLPQRSTTSSGTRTWSRTRRPRSGSSWSSWARTGSRP